MYTLLSKPQEHTFIKQRAEYITINHKKGIKQQRYQGVYTKYNTLFW